MPNAPPSTADALAPDALHIATEDPLGNAARRYCVTNHLAFTTSYHTQLPLYVRKRLPIPDATASNSQPLGRSSRTRAAWRSRRTSTRFCRSIYRGPRSNRRRHIRSGRCVTRGSATSRLGCARDKPRGVPPHGARSYLEHASAQFLSSRARPRRARPARPRISVRGYCG
jgi:hypothetical protein